MAPEGSQSLPTGIKKEKTRNMREYPECAGTLP